MNSEKYPHLFWDFFLLNTFKIVIAIQNELFQNITFYYMKLYDHKCLDMKQ